MLLCLMIKERCATRHDIVLFSGDRRSVRPGAPSEPNEYNFNYHKRGLFIIINNKNFHPSTGKESRDGTDADAERLEERFQDLGFDVRRYNDVSSSKLLQLMNDGTKHFYLFIFI